MPVQVKLDRDKYTRRASAAAPEYTQGTQTPRRSQSEAAAAAKDLWLQAVQDAGARDAFAKGLRRAGDEKWRKGVTEKGRTRYQQGVQLAGEEWAEGMQPMVSALSALTLQPRGPKGQNYGRVQQVGDALRAAKLGQ